MSESRESGDEGRDDEGGVFGVMVFVSEVNHFAVSFRRLFYIETINTKGLLK